MIYILYSIHVVICLFLILVVLLQQGSGADLSVFGGGGTQTAFGARSATNLLHRLTVAGFIGFIVTTMAIGLLSTSGSGGSVMSGVDQETAQEEPAPLPAPDATTGDETTAAPEAAPVETDVPPPAADESGSTQPPASEDENG